MSWYEYAGPSTLPQGFTPGLDEVSMYLNVAVVISADLVELERTLNGRWASMEGFKTRDKSFEVPNIGGLQEAEFYCKDGSKQ